MLRSSKHTSIYLQTASCACSDQIAHVCGLRMLRLNCTRMRTAHAQIRLHTRACSDQTVHVCELRILRSDCTRVHAQIRLTRVTTVHAQIRLHTCACSDQTVNVCELRMLTSDCTRVQSDLSIRSSRAPKICSQYFSIYWSLSFCCYSI